MNADQLVKLARYAVLAPSSHNTQPWKIRVAPRYADVAADRTRALPENDPTGRELTISCGCALMNLRLGALELALEPIVELFPDGVDAETFARVELSSSRTTELDAQLLDAISQRHTHREAFREQPVTEELVRRLEAETVREGGWLTVLTDIDMRRAITGLVAEGDRAQWSNPKWRRELASWMRPRSKGDGLATPLLLTPITRAAIRSFDLGEKMSAANRVLVESAPVLAILGTYGDSAPDWLVAGQALQRLLLAAASHDVQAGFLNQPVQIAGLREKLTATLGVAGFPQIVLRLGYPPAPIQPAPRRKLSDVVRILT